MSLNRILESEFRGFARIVFLICCLGWVDSASGQQIEVLVRGIVADSATWKPIPMVNIRIKNTSRGTVTDQQGSFTLGASRSDTLVISYVGYRTRQITLWDWEESVILMAEAPTKLFEVIVFDKRLDQSYYRFLFRDQIYQQQTGKRKLAFYQPRYKKELFKLQLFKDEEQRTQIFNDLIVRSDTTRNTLMRKYDLSEDEYYGILLQFTELNYDYMYYLSAPELISLLYQFFHGKAIKEDR